MYAPTKKCEPFQGFLFLFLRLWRVGGFARTEMQMCSIGACTGCTAVLGSGNVRVMTWVLPELPRVVHVGVAMPRFWSLGALSVMHVHDRKGESR